MIGVVLPVVLIVLTVLTGLVVTQVRRSAIDERLAANATETVLLDSAAQTVLRWCEARIVTQPFATALADPSTTTPPWRVAANWTNTTKSLDFTTAGLPGITGAPACVIEEATCELTPPISPTGQTATGCNGIDPRWRKYRITARVAVPALDMMGGNRFMFAQSELRIFTD
jgi:Tfp pilus assembly protein PilX